MLFAPILVPREAGVCLSFLLRGGYAKSECHSCLIDVLGLSDHVSVLFSPNEGLMGSIAYDSRSGRLVLNLIWRFGVVTDWERDLDLGFAFGEWLGREEESKLHECPVDRSHQTGTTTTSVEIGLRGGAMAPDFLALTNHGFPIVSGAMAARLRESQLSGYKLINGVKIVENTSEAGEVHLKLFSMPRRAGFCLRWRVHDASNLCPYCEKEPILCSGCGWRDFFECLQCGRRVHHGGGYRSTPDGKSLELKPESHQWIVEAKDWDGSDLFSVGGHGGGWFVNHRAKAWFERCHVLGVDFEPALLNVEGLVGRLPDGTKF